MTPSALQRTFLVELGALANIKRGNCSLDINYEPMYFVWVRARVMCTPRVVIWELKKFDANVVAV